MSDTPRTDRPGTGSHLFFLLCIALCGVVVGWAYFGRLDIVSMAIGEVVPMSQVKMVQHLEGGIVRKIMVAEGETVTAGQPLVELESTASGADVGELNINVVSLRVEITRLAAEANGDAELAFDADLEAEHPDLVDRARDFFRARRMSLQSAIDSQKEAVIQRQQDINEITARIANRRKSLKLLEEQIRISEELLKDNLTNRYNHLNLLQDATKTKGGIEEDQVALKRSQAALNEAKSNLTRLDNVFVEEARSELGEKRRRLEELTQRLGKYRDSLARTVLRSPVDGVVKELFVSTRGGVVQPGANVVEIVPGEDRLVVEAKLPIQDIGYVAPGQKARIKLASADGMRFGAIEGHVTVISPDALITKEGLSFYKVKLETDKSYFEYLGTRYKLYPGMQVMVSVLTGRRAVWEYLLTPFLFAAQSALQER